jgi:hypothetical protein
MALKRNAARLPPSAIYTDKVEGPIPDGGGPSDYPEHCGDCGIFLRNGLSLRGYELLEMRFDAYVQDVCHNPNSQKRGLIPLWADFYGLARGG